jgi:hypothetical protein
MRQIFLAMAFSVPTQLIASTTADTHGVTVVSSVATREVGTTEKSVIEILKKISQPDKCSTIFANFIVASVDKYLMEGNTKSFADILTTDGAQNEPVGTCRPMKQHVGDFVSMSQGDAKRIAEKILEAVKSKSQSSAGSPTQAQILADIVVPVLTFFNPAQLRFAQLMSEIAQPDKEMGTAICSSDASGGVVLGTSPEMSIGIGDNYFLSLIRFLRRLYRCSTDAGGSSDAHVEAIFRNRIVPNDFIRTCGISANDKDVKIHILYRCLEDSRPSEDFNELTIFKDEEHPEVVTVVGSAEKSPKKTPLSPPHIATQTFIASSIANEEKIFFTNFHNAAQQLSLLGINAVGLATQIQAIRGHIMMLQLIDEHIGTLTKDHERYTQLLTDAHKQLRKVTGIPDQAQGNA